LALLSLVVLVSAFAPLAISHRPRPLPLDGGENEAYHSSRMKTGGSAELPGGGKGIVHLRGRLVEGGAECQRFRASDNRFFTLTGDLRGFRTGDNVEITGKIATVSHCMQDTTIQVLTIRKLKT
jgi:hypothetical protein